MRYAIISDIHSNLESLKEFLKLLPQYKIEKIICLGDIVGYNTNPNECVKIISQLPVSGIVRGNHDRVVLSRNYNDFSEDAKLSLNWTINNLDSFSIDFLNKISSGPRQINDNFAICHGSLTDEDFYILSAYHTKEEFQWMIYNNIRLTFFGHTHYQISYLINNKKKEINSINQKKFTLDPDNYYLINPGSIGQPRDRINKASFAVYDSDFRTIEIVRYKYDIKLTKQKINMSGLPKFLGERLEKGI